LTRCRKGGIDPESFQDLTELVETDRTADDDCSTDVAYFRAVGGVDLGCKKIVGRVDVCAGCAEPADEARRDQRCSGSSRTGLTSPYKRYDHMIGCIPLA